MKPNQAALAETQRGSPIELNLVICTFHREPLLAKTLASLSRQQCPDTLRVRVTVVDNSDEGTAAGVVERFSRESSFDMRWVPAHPANIAVARNAGVKAHVSDYVAFLDDDNEIGLGWLGAVAEAIRAYPYDVYFGAYEARFEIPELATAAARQVFSRRFDFPAGRELFAMGPRQSHDFSLGTNNSIFRRAALPMDPAPFDLAFGHGGGEDYDLLCRMQQDGRRFGWAPGALAYEFVPASRCDPVYLRRRFFVGGQTFAAGVAGSSGRPRATRWWLRFKAVAQAVVLAARLPLAAWRGGEAFLDYSYRFAGVLGKMSFGEVMPIYRRSVAARK